MICFARNISKEFLGVLSGTLKTVSLESVKHPHGRVSGNDTNQFPDPCPSGQAGFRAGFFSFDFLYLCSLKILIKCQNPK